MRTSALVFAALMTFTASGFSMHQAGWFGGKTPRSAETPQARTSDPLLSEAALRYRHNQSTNWRLVMALR